MRPKTAFRALGLLRQLVRDGPPFPGVSRSLRRQAAPPGCSYISSILKMHSPPRLMPPPCPPTKCVCVRACVHHLPAQPPSVCVCVCVCVCLASNSWTVALWASLSMGFPRQEYWSGLLFLTLISCVHCIAGGFFTSEPPGKPIKHTF